MTSKERAERINTALPNNFGGAELVDAIQSAIDAAEAGKDARIAELEGALELVLDFYRMEMTKFDAKYGQSFGEKQMLAHIRAALAKPAEGGKHDAERRNDAP